MAGLAAKPSFDQRTCASVLSRRRPASAGRGWRRRCRRRGSARPRCSRTRSIGLVQQVEQARGRFDRVAACAEGDVALDRRRSRSDIRRRALRSRPGAAAWPAHNGWRAGRGLRSRRCGPRPLREPRSGRGGAGAAARRSRRRWSIQSRAAVGPASMISGMRPPSEASTCAARVGLIRPLALADGAASGLPTAASSACIAGCAGHPERDGRQAGGDDAGDRRVREQRHDQGQRARPMRLGKRARLGIEGADRLGGGEVGDMDDQRVEGRAALGGVDARDGGGVGGVGGEAVDGLGRHRDRLAGEDQPRRFGDRGIVERQDAGAVWRGHDAAAMAWRRLASRDAAHMSFHCPVRDQRFVLDHVVRIGELSNDADMVDAVLEGAAAFAEGAFRAARPDRRHGRREMGGRRRDHAAGVSRGLCRLRRGRLGDPRGAGGRGRAGASAEPRRPR